MNHELAKTLTTALVQFIDKNHPKDKMDVSSIEAEELERCLTEEKFNRVEDWYANRMKPEQTEFEEKLVSFALQCGGQWDTANEEAKKWSNEFLSLAKKELLSYADESNPAIEAMADLERTYFCNPDKLPKWLKDDIARKELDAHAKGYNKGYKDAENLYKESTSIVYHPPIMPTQPSGWGCDGTHCTNPQMDCINCPRRTTGGSFSTSSASGTSAATLHGNTSATDGKEHNPSFTD